MNRITGMTFGGGGLETGAHGIGGPACIERAGMPSTERQEFAPLSKRPKPTFGPVDQGQTFGLGLSDQFNQENPGSWESRFPLYRVRVRMTARVTRCSSG